MNDERDDNGFGGGFWLRFIGVMLAIVIAAWIFFLFLGWVWGTWGFLASVIAFVAIAVGAGYLYDRRERLERSKYAA
jgi:hypothetical protein